MRKKIIWIAEIDGREIECSSKAEALEVEETQTKWGKIQELSEIFHTYFKLYYDEHDEHDRYRYPCVDCGKLLFEYECEWDGHRNEVGKLIERESDRLMFLGGWRCRACDKKAEELFTEMMRFGSQHDPKFLLSIRDMSKLPNERNAEEFELKLKMCEMVLYYHENYKKVIKRKGTEKDVTKKN